MRIKIGHLLFVFGSTQAFVVPSALHSRSLTTTNNNKNDAFFSSWSRLEAKKGKGFGEKNASPSPKKSLASPPPAAAAAAAAASTSTATATPQPREDPIAVANSNPFPAIVQPDLSMGKAALERLKREQVEKRDEELRKVKQIKDVDTMLRESPEAAVIPEKVAQRMGARMLPFVGIPLLGGMGAFVGFWYMSTYQGMSYEPSLVAASTIALLVFGLLGITYSLMSASWDADREGSLLGTEEFQRNVNNIKDGLSRSRENAVLRDRMVNISDAELKGLESRDAARMKKQQSFNDKINDDLD